MIVRLLFITLIGWFLFLLSFVNLRNEPIADLPVGPLHNSFHL